MSNPFDFGPPGGPPSMHPNFPPRASYGGPPPGRPSFAGPPGFNAGGPPPSMGPRMSMGGPPSMGPRMSMSGPPMSMNGMPPSMPAYGTPFIGDNGNGEMMVIRKKNKCKRIGQIFIGLTFILTALYVVYSFGLFGGKDFVEVIKMSDSVGLFFDDQENANYSIAGDIDLTADAEIDITFPAGVPMESLAPGKVIMSTATDVAPYGFIREVLSSEEKPDGSVVVTTGNATLSQAFKELRLKKSVDVNMANLTNTAQEVDGMETEVLSTTNEYGHTVFEKPIEVTPEVKLMSSYVHPDLEIEGIDLNDVHTLRHTDEGGEKNGFRINLSKEIDIKGKTIKLDLSGYMGMALVFETTIAEDEKEETRIGVRFTVDVDYSLGMELDIIDICDIAGYFFPKVNQSDISADGCYVNLVSFTSLILPVWFLPVGSEFGVNLEMNSQIAVTYGLFGSYRNVYETGVVFKEGEDMDTYALKKPAPSKNSTDIPAPIPRPGFTVNGNSAIGLALYYTVKPYGLMGPAFQVVAGVEQLAAIDMWLKGRSLFYQKRQAFLRGYLTLSTAEWLKKLLSKANIKMVVAFELFKKVHVFSESTIDLLDGGESKCFVEVLKIENGKAVPFQKATVSALANDLSGISGCVTGETGICMLDILSNNFHEGGSQLLSISHDDIHLGTQDNQTYGILQKRPDVGNNLMITVVVGETATPKVNTRLPAEAVGQNTNVIIEKCIRKRSTYVGVPSDRDVTSGITLEDKDNTKVVEFPVICDITAVHNGISKSCSDMMLYLPTTTVDMKTCTNDPVTPPNAPVPLLPHEIGVYWGSAGPSDSFGVEQYETLRDYGVSQMMLTIHSTKWPIAHTFIGDILDLANQAGVASFQFTAMMNPRIKGDITPQTAYSIGQGVAANTLGIANKLKYTNLLPGAMIWGIAHPILCGTDWCETWRGVTKTSISPGSMDQTDNCNFVLGFVEYIEEHYTNGPPEGHRVGLIIGDHYDDLFGMGCTMGETVNHIIFKHDTIDRTSDCLYSGCSQLLSALDMNKVSIHGRSLGYGSIREHLENLPNESPYTSKANILEPYDVVEY